MKIKTDFVTNSSSSSFIVAFVNRVKSFEDVKEFVPLDDKALQVYKDAKAQKPVKIRSTNRSLLNKIAKEIRNGYVYDRHVKEISYSDFQKDFCRREGITSEDLYQNRAWMKAFYDEYENAQLKAALKIATRFVQENEGAYMYIFHYGDEDGEFFSEMEHGGTFNNLQHVTISRH